MDFQSHIVGATLGAFSFQDTLQDGFSHGFHPNGFGMAANWLIGSSSARSTRNPRSFRPTSVLIISCRLCPDEIRPKGRLTQTDVPT